MYVNLVCGPCTSVLEMDAEDNDTAVWMLIHRFSNAHTECGFVAPVQTDETVAARQR